MKLLVCLVVLFLSSSYGVLRSWAGYRYYGNFYCSGPVYFVDFNGTDCSEQPNANWQQCLQYPASQKNPNLYYYGANSAIGGCYTFDDDGDSLNQLAAYFTHNFSVGVFPTFNSSDCNSKALQGVSFFNANGTVCLDNSAPDNSTISSYKFTCSSSTGMELDVYSGRTCGSYLGYYGYSAGCNANDNSTDTDYSVNYCINQFFSSSTASPSSSSSTSFNSSSSSSSFISSSSSSRSSSSSSSSSPPPYYGSSSAQSVPSDAQSVLIYYSSCYAAAYQYCDGQSDTYSYGGKCEDLSSASCNQGYSQFTAPVGYTSEVDNNKFMMFNTTVDRDGCIYMDGVLLSASSMSRIPINGGNSGCQTETTYCVSTYACALYACAPHQCAKAGASMIQASMMLILISLGLVFNM